MRVCMCGVARVLAVAVGAKNPQGSSETGAGVHPQRDRCLAWHRVQ